MSAGTEGEARAWGWVAHLRTGGTTPWVRWEDPASPEDRRGRYLPGAQQLELLRRLNLEGRPGPALAERVLSADAPGRGRPDLGLVGVLPESRFGAPPVDPAELAVGELVRVAVSLIAEDVVGSGHPAPPRRSRRFRRHYRLVGDPGLARPVREALLADGRPPGGRGATGVVVGTDVATMLTHLWTARAFGAGVRPWPEWLARELRRPALPARIDLAARADDLARRLGRSRVHVVLGDPRRAARLAGGRRIRPALVDLSADSVELARRTGPVVALLVPPERRSHLMWHRLRPVLAATDGPTLRVPARHRGRLREHTDRLRRRLADGDYAVHGDLPDPSDGPGETAPDEEGVLAVAVRLLLEAPLVGPDAEPRARAGPGDRPADGPTRGVTVAASTMTEAGEGT